MGTDTSSRHASVETGNDAAASEAVPAGTAMLPEVAEQARAFQQVRESRRDELVEDYVELIDDLIREDGEARQVDIAARLGVAQPTVARMLKRLLDEGLVARRAYRGVFLTERGKTLADESRARHQIVEAFLIALGVPAETARRDAEGIEHRVSAETLEAFKAFAEQARNRNSGGTPQAAKPV